MKRKSDTFKFFIPYGIAEKPGVIQYGYSVRLPYSIFNDKEYPTCKCGEKYIPKLGCLLCNQIRY